MPGSFRGRQSNLKLLHLTGYVDFLAAWTSASLYIVGI